MNLLIPVVYLVFWAFLLVFSFVSEPMVCGVGVIIILTGVPIFFLGVFWRSKPKCVHRLTGEPGLDTMPLGGEGGHLASYPRARTFYQPGCDFPQSFLLHADVARSHLQRKQLPAHGRCLELGSSRSQRIKSPWSIYLSVCS